MNSLVLLLLPLLLIPLVTAEDERLTMCPPGGSSFTMAWSMACSMRKKRSTENGPVFREKRGLVAPTVRQMQQICCEVGCTIADLLPYCGPFAGW